MKKLQHNSHILQVALVCTDSKCCNVFWDRILILVLMTKGRANIDGSKTVGQLRDIQQKIQVHFNGDDTLK